MPTVIEKTVYSFQELLDGKNTRATENARQWLSESITSHDWWDIVYEDYTAALKQIGIHDLDIQFSGFWSQGDGASFTCKFDVEALIDFMTAKINPSTAVHSRKDGSDEWRSWIVNKVGVVYNKEWKKLKKWTDDLSLRVVRTGHHYVHENTCDVEGEVYYNSEMPERLQELWSDFVKEVESMRYKLCKAIYNSLEETYEAETSDESLADFAAANEYKFDADGRIE